jgi:hypothetical protein
VPVSRIAAVAAAGLLAGGAVATRFGVFRAGPASVADPKYVVASAVPVTGVSARRGDREHLRAGRAAGRGPRL